MVQNGPKLSKMVQIGPKLSDIWSNIVQNCPKVSNIVQNSPTSLNIVQHLQTYFQKHKIQKSTHFNVEGVWPRQVQGHNILSLHPAPFMNISLDIGGARGCVCIPQGSQYIVDLLSDPKMTPKWGSTAQRRRDCTGSDPHRGRGRYHSK